MTATKISKNKESGTSEAAKTGKPNQKNVGDVAAADQGSKYPGKAGGERWDGPKKS